jgi:hypothetical protein
MERKDGHLWLKSLKSNSKYKVELESSAEKGKIFIHQ